MGIELIIVGLGLVAVLITNGSYKKLFTTKFNHSWALLIVAAGHLAVLFAPIEKSQYDTVGLGILLGSYVFLFGFCLANLDKFGMIFVMAGTICNALVIGLNKGMPVTTSGGFEVKESIKHQVAQSGDLLPWLGDILPINAISIAISVGDIFFALGILCVFVACSRKGKKVKSEAEQLDSADRQNAVEIMAEMQDVSSAIGHTTDEVPVVVVEDHHGTTATMVDERNDETVMIDLTHEEQVAMLEPTAREMPAQVEANEPKAKKKYKGTKPIKNKRTSRRWQRTHGLNALPSKEELGYDDGSMEIVDAAE